MRKEINRLEGLDGFGSSVDDLAHKLQTALYFSKPNSQRAAFDVGRSGRGGQDGQDRLNDTMKALVEDDVTVHALATGALRTSTKDAEMSDAPMKFYQYWEDKQKPRRGR